MAEIISLLQEFGFALKCEPENGVSLMPSGLNSASCQSRWLVPQRARRGALVWELERTLAAGCGSRNLLIPQEGAFLEVSRSLQWNSRAGAAHRPPEQPELELDHLEDPFSVSCGLLSFQTSTDWSGQILRHSDGKSDTVPVLREPQTSKES